MPKISFLTFAYNSEKYIEKCAQSVLSQTLEDIEWIVIDNGCTDRTYDILKKYADRDSRMRIYRNRENSHKKDADYQYMDYYSIIPLVQGEYFATLDSDDAYDVNFAQEMYSAAKENDADMVMCGNRFVEEASGREIGRRMPPQFSGDVKAMCKALPAFYACLRPMWERLYKTETWRAHEGYLLEHMQGMQNGADTYLNLKYLSVCKKVTSVCKVLHEYLVRNSSVYSSNLYMDRYKCYDLIFLEGLTLLTRMDAASVDNVTFLYNVHIESLKDLIGVAERAIGAAYEDRILFLIKLVHSPVFLLYYRKIDTKLLESFLEPTLVLTMQLVTQALEQGGMTEKLSLEASRFLKAFEGNPHDLEKQIVVDKLSDYTRCLEDARKTAIITNPEKCASLMMKKENGCPLLVVANTAFYERYTDICFMILQKRYGEALEHMSELLLEQDPIEDRETFLQLYLTVAAANEDEVAFVYAKFQLAWFYFDNKQLHLCSEAVQELTEMGFEDHEDLVRLREMLETAG